MSRRSLVYLFLIVISIALVFTGCLPLRQKETSAEEYVEVNEAYFVMQETNNAYYVEMYAGVSHLVGYIRYGITEVSGERYLYVNYDLTSTDWYLLETRLATAVTEYGTTGLPRTSGGQLDPNSYPEEFNRTWDRGDSKQSYEYLIPLGDMQGSIWFATWAKVEREENNTWSTTYAKAYHGPCSYEVPIPPVEQKEALPILDMTVDGTVTGFPSGSYGWTLSKTVDPDSFSFFTGTPATEVALYTLTATRTGPTQDATTARIEGNAEVTNNSTATTALLDYVKVNLQGYSGSWSTIEEKTLANDVLLAKSPGPDNSKDYDYFFEFNPSEYSKFRVLAETIDTKTASLNVSASATSNEMTVVEETANATATVEDVMGSIDRPGSDVTVESGYSGPWIIDGNWSITYPATLTFNGQGNPDFYALPNTATLTSGLFNVSDDATVTISIIAGQTEAPILEATPTLEVVWLRELEYLWDIEKDASPTSIELAKGQMKNIEYTIQVTRTTGESTDTYTASGTVFVQNVGTAPALNVNAEVQLQGAESVAGPFGDIGSQVDLGLVPGSNLDPGENHTFNFSFDFTPPSTATHFRIKADVTSSAPDITRYSNTVGPVMPVVTTIDATATVTDQLNPPDGFSAAYVGSPFDWVVSDSTSTTYDVSVTNNDIDSGTHYLTNTATLTTSDRGVKHTDDATVTITVPDENLPILEATPTLEVVWLQELEYLWDIEKDASPTSIELPIGQTKDVEYTIQVTRTTGESTDTYTASGTVFVQNVGDAPALGVNAKVQLQGADSDAGPFGDIESQVDLGSVTGDNLGIGESHTFNFSFDFTPPSTATHFRIKADVTSSAPDITRYSNTVGPVMPVVTTIDATATVTDKLNPPDGFTADYVLNPFDWVVSESSTLTYSVFLENESVYYGLHLLTNTATLTTSDRGIEHTDNATVTITVPHDEECVTETAWGEGSQFPGAKQWGMYFVLESDETYKEVRLIAGQHTPVGSVTVERISDNQLLVTYSLSHPWTMSEYHLHVASSLDHIPTTPGPVQNPIPGAFEYKADNLGNVTSISITTSEITGKVFIAAHAVVSDCYPYEPPDPEIDTKTLLGRYFVGYEDTYDDFDYNDFGMLFEVTEFYERVVGETEFYLTYVEMEFTPMVKDAGWTHLIRILRKLEGNYTYTISRDTVGTGSETPAAANVSGSGDLGLVLFDTSRYTQGWNNPDKDRDDSVFVQIWIEDGNTANELPTTPPRSFNVGNGDFYDLDPLMENYDPWMFVKNNDNIIRIDDVAQTSDKYNNQSNESAITVPWILVVPDLDFRPPKEGLPIVVAYPEFDDFYRTGKPANADWYNRPAGSNHHWNTLSEENLFYW
jgi:hypothetical protein